jgi:hypothetical protein
MAIPYTTKFNILDYNYRATDSTDLATAGSALLTDADDPISEFAYVPYSNVVLGGPSVPTGSMAIVASASAIATPRKVESRVVLEGESLEGFDEDGLTISQGIPSTFTFEFDISFPVDPDTGEAALPKDFSDPDNRVVVGAFNKQGGCAAFAFSHQGIALVSRVEDPFPTILGGSAPGPDSKFFEPVTDEDAPQVPKSLSIRAVVDGDYERIAIYIKESEQAYPTSWEFTDAEVGWTLPMKQSESPLGEVILVHGSAQSEQYLSNKLQTTEPALVAGQDAIFIIRSLRLSGTKVLPQDRPIADCMMDRAVQVRVPTTISGANSYDRLGRPLTYNWEIIQAPQGSKANLSGASYSFATLKVSNDDGTQRSVAHIIYTTPTSAANDFTVEVTLGPAESYVATSFDEESGVLSIVLGADSFGQPRTTAEDLVAAFHDEKALGYSMDVSGGVQLASLEAITDPISGATSELWQEGKRVLDRKFRIVLSKQSIGASDLLETGVFPFSGGNGSAVREPLFIPDVPGVYGFRLIVDNGVRKSFPDMVPTTASLTEQLMGHRPDSSYIFKHLPDFWNLVKDKGQLPAIWSAMTQALSNDMLTAWENDFAKTLRDISRKSQRRWQKFDLFEAFPELSHGGLVGQDPFRGGIDVSEPDVSENSSFSAVFPSLSATAPFVKGPALLRTNFDKARVVEVSEVAESPAGWNVLTSERSLPYYYEIAKRSGGFFIQDPEDITPTTPIVSKVFKDLTYPFSKVDLSLDRIRLHKRDESLDVVCSASDYAVGGQSNSLRLDLVDDREVSGYRLLWEHLRKATHVSLEQMPYFQIPANITVADYKLSLGDSLRIDYVEPYSTIGSEIDLPILACRENTIYVDWSPLIELLDKSSAQFGDVVGYLDETTPIHRTWSTSDLSEVSSFIPKGIVRCHRTASTPTMVSVPTLCRWSVYPVDGETGILQEKVDYQVSDGSVVFNRILVASATTKLNSQTLLLSKIRTKPGVLSDRRVASEFIDAVTAAGARTIIVGTGPDCGVYYIIGWDAAGNPVLDRPMTSDMDSVPISIPFYSCHTNPSDSLWSELSYYDNYKTIEGNFGLVVGFPKKLLDTYSEDLDYLSVVRSLWFAFMSGPSFSNLKLSTQAFFNLPFSEMGGQVTGIDLPLYPGNTGSITFVGDDGGIYLYDVPFGAKIAINPATGREIKAHDLIQGKDPDPLPEDLLDSRVEPYVKLVDVVNIVDYISDPDLIDRQFGGDYRRYVDDAGVIHEIDLDPTVAQKFHTFVVDVPLKVARTTEVFPLVKAFLNEAKPAYTDFILVGSLALGDDVDVEDNTILHPTLLMGDTPHTSPFCSYGESPVPDDRLLKVWPKDKTVERVASIDYSPIIDATETYVDEAGDNKRVSLTAHYDLPGGRSGDPGWTMIPMTGVTAEYRLAAWNLPQPWAGFGTFTAPGFDSTALGAAIIDVFTPPTSAVAIRVVGEEKVRLFTVNGYGLTHGGFAGSPIGFAFELASTDGFNQHLYEGKNIEMFFINEDVANVPPPAVTYWTADPVHETILDPITGEAVDTVSDVFEKYESSYREGVLDDYSGDGSWNKRRKQLDMVNGLNSDLDVPLSRIWVPVMVSPSHDSTEFGGLIVGEELEFVHTITPNTVKKFDTIWNDSPPVVLHIGLGHHPKLPFGIEDPFRNHTHTYVLLGFEPKRRQKIVTVDESESYDYAAAELHNYGREDRLDVLKNVRDNIMSAPPTQTINGGEPVNDIGLWALRGKQSGALVKVREETDGIPGFNETLDRHNPAHERFFFLETIWQQDKLIENGPKSISEVIITKYIPLGGMVINDFKNGMIDGLTQYDKQVQTLPYDTALPSDEQFVPSSGPGLFVDWDNKNAAADKVVWDWVEPAQALSPANPVATFDAPAASLPLENVHVGFKFRPRKDYHYSHGFCEAVILPPKIKLIQSASSGYDLRIGGFYFCADDPTRVNVPNATPDSYGNPLLGEGVVGGMWIFFRNSETLQEFAVPAGQWIFETGINPGMPIVPSGRMSDGIMKYVTGSATQPSDGHVIELHIPDLPTTGYYDIILRNYRPYQLWSGGDWNYHMTETVANKAYYYETSGYGGVAWGTGSYGGVNNG